MAPGRCQGRREKFFILPCPDLLTRHLLTIEIKTSSLLQLLFDYLRLLREQTSHFLQGKRDFMTEGEATEQKSVAGGLDPSGQAEESHAPRSSAGADATRELQQKMLPSVGAVGVHTLLADVRLLLSLSDPAGKSKSYLQFNKL